MYCKLILVKGTEGRGYCCNFRLFLLSLKEGKIPVLEIDLLPGVYILNAALRHLRP